jgi:RNA polymerase sigma-70 factor (ECF subfamily)
MADGCTAVTTLLRAWRQGDRSHFFALAARQMRRILVDFARARRYQKRGGGAFPVTFDEALAVSRLSPDLIALDDAVELLAAKDERKARVVELRFFGGLTNEEIAAGLGISTDTVTRDWQMAKLWLRREMKRDKKQ